MCSTLTTLKHPATTLSPQLESHISLLKTSKHIVHTEGLHKLLQTASLTLNPKPLPQVIENVNIGPYGVGIGHNEFIGDCMKIYSYTIAYLFTKDIKYVEMYKLFQDAWNIGCKSFTGSNAPLECAWGGTCMLRAAEIMKHQQGLLSADFLRRFDSFLERIILPNLKLRYQEIKKWRNNWILSIQEALIQYAMYKNDVKLANQFIKEFCSSICDCVPHTSGMCTETKRDLIHTQFQLGSMIQICEMCWHQGIDLYSFHDSCVMRCMEYHARILLGETPTGVLKNELKDIYFMPCAWDIGYNHFTKRLKGSMPFTDTLLKKPRNRPEKLTFNWGPGWLHYNLG